MSKEMKKGFWVFGFLFYSVYYCCLFLKTLVTESHIVFGAVKMISLLVFGTGRYFGLYHEAVAKDEMRKYI